MSRPRLSKCFEFIRMKRVIHHRQTAEKKFGWRLVFYSFTFHDFQQSPTDFQQMAQQRIIHFQSSARIKAEFPCYVLFYYARRWWQNPAGVGWLFYFIFFIKIIYQMVWWAALARRILLNVKILKMALLVDGLQFLRVFKGEIPFDTFVMVQRLIQIQIELWSNPFSPIV